MTRTKSQHRNTCCSLDGWMQTLNIEHVCGPEDLARTCSVRIIDLAASNESRARLSLIAPSLPRHSKLSKTTGVSPEVWHQQWTSSRRHYGGLATFESFGANSIVNQPSIRFSLFPFFSFSLLFLASFHIHPGCPICDAILRPSTEYAHLVRQAKFVPPETPRHFHEPHRDL